MVGFLKLAFERIKFYIMHTHFSYENLILLTSETKGIQSNLASDVTASGFIPRLHHGEV